MRTQAFVLLAVAAVALAGDPPSGYLPPSKDPKRCLERLDEFPNRSGTRLDILDGRCVKARTYTGKYGPYNGDHFFEACCKNKKGEFTEPTWVNLDQCISYDTFFKEVEAGKNGGSTVKDKCSKCVVGDDGRGMTSLTPFLRCHCKGDDGKDAESKIILGTATFGEDSFWVDDEGKLQCGGGKESNDNDWDLDNDWDWDSWEKNDDDDDKWAV
ncbi:hypothetical protein Brms1b_007703 [Colletotrichum noveboracense]|nr:hypothetical protein CBS470a_006746 [Colletotrichum nupharicola]KAJ0312777.1 hypothetical protein Brms1b_007703 [Colletotrichum noveboracense]